MGWAGVKFLYFCFWEVEGIHRCSFAIVANRHDVRLVILFIST